MHGDQENPMNDLDPIASGDCNTYNIKREAEAYDQARFTNIKKLHECLYHFGECTITASMSCVPLAKALLLEEAKASGGVVLLRATIST
jgi:hypothetical protein